jgi:hypothetical protein
MNPDYKAEFSAMSYQELVDIYNRDASTTEWVSERADYIRCLLLELERRDPKSRAEAQARMEDGCVCKFCRRHKKLLATLPMERAREMKWDHSDKFHAHGLGVSLD